MRGKSVRGNKEEVSSRLKGGTYMKIGCLNPTDENLFDTLEKDYIGRTTDVINFVRMICAIDGGSSIALDAKWGEGKTFFVKQAKLILDAYNDYGYDDAAHGLLDADKAKKIKDIFNKAYPGYVVPSLATIYYDAWEHDNDEDPVLSLVDSIVESGMVNLDYERMKGLLIQIIPILSNLVEAVSKIPVYSITKELTKIANSKGELSAIDELVVSQKKKREIKALVNEFFDSISNEVENGIIIFIDELDRCKPLYAVKLLERIKHYFSNDKIKFIFAINKEETQHTIKCVYGQGYDGARYLDRFFDYSITLPNYDKAKLYNYILGESPNRDNLYIEEVSENFGLSIRELIKLKSICKIALTDLHSNKYSNSFYFDDYLKNSYLLIFLMIGLRMYNVSEYNLFISGNGFDIYEKYIMRMPKLKKLYADVFYGYGKEYNAKDFDEKLRKYYDLMLTQKEQYFDQKIGNVHVSNTEAIEIKRIASMLSSWCSIE